MAFSLKQLMLKEMKRNRIRSLGSKNTLWPSQARVVTSEGKVLGQCLRASYWNKIGETITNPTSEEVTLMGYMGNQIEDGLIDIIKNNGLWEANNVKWQAHNLSGEVDVIVRVNEENEQGNLEEKLYIVECKSCSGYFANKEVFGYNKGAGANKQWVAGKPKDKHLMQAAIYAYVGKDKFEGTLVIYISRDEAKLMEFLIKVDNEGRIYINEELEYRFTINDILASYEVLQTALDLQQLPEKDYKPVYSDAEVQMLYEAKEISKTAFDGHNDKTKLYMDKECSYCNYKDKCLNNYINTASETPKKIELKKNNDWDFFDLPTNISEEKPAYILSGSY